MQNTLRHFAFGLALLVIPLSCQREQAPGDAGTRDETAAEAGRSARGAGRAGGAGGGSEESETTVVGRRPTTATDATTTGAPSPPGGYAVESRPAAEGKLALIEYASPRMVPELSSFYDGELPSARRIELEVAADNIVVYGLSGRTTVGPSTTPVDVERLLDQRSEPLVVLSPWRIQRNDPLIHDLREAGLSEQADVLLNTKTKVTVVYAVP